ncbi:hypothetical protein B0J11DRAFT_37109 [Dendryphion nanum]|uniref:Uncharacterized protein n=1 Tax=Dendryphion nanum TaxID=256645 RepID=A0A9P9EJW9_9PLEO|nr:hypothetical protein B0J11DRAFT_37109 [Dendryphion nanum]
MSTRVAISGNRIVGLYLLATSRPLGIFWETLEMGLWISRFFPSCDLSSLIVSLYIFSLRCLVSSANEVTIYATHVDALPNPFLLMRNRSFCLAVCLLVSGVRARFGACLNFVHLPLVVFFFACRLWMGMN